MFKQAGHPYHDHGALQEEVLAVGRVCCDSEGRLNECSVLLEGSMELSGGQRVRLDLSKLQNFGVFPGQVGRKLTSSLTMFCSGSACVLACIKLQGFSVVQGRCSASCTACLPASGRTTRRRLLAVVFSDLPTARHRCWTTCSAHSCCTTCKRCRATRLSQEEAQGHMGNFSSCQRQLTDANDDA